MSSTAVVDSIEPSSLPATPTTQSAHKATLTPKATMQLPTPISMKKRPEQIASTNLDTTMDKNMLNGNDDQSRDIVLRKLKVIWKYYSKLKHRNDIDLGMVLKTLRHCATLWLKILRADEQGERVLYNALPIKHRRMMISLCKDLENKYKDAFVEYFNNRVKRLPQIEGHPTQIVSESSFTELGNYFKTAWGSNAIHTDKFERRTWRLYVPIFEDERHEEIMRRINTAHFAFQVRMYLESVDEKAKLWYLMWKNLSAAQDLCKLHNLLHPLGSTLEDDFFAQDMIKKKFDKIAKNFDFMNPRVIEDVVACYCSLIEDQRRESGDEELMMDIEDSTSQLSKETISRLAGGPAQCMWDPELLSALRQAAARLNYLMGGPMVIRRDIMPSKLQVLNEIKAAFSKDPPPIQKLSNDIGEFIQCPQLMGRNFISAYDYVYHPFPENRANQVAQSRLIFRDLREPGVISDGARIEDCVNLPPPHCRPPGTYTGFKKRDPRGPYEVLKVMSVGLLGLFRQKQRCRRPEATPGVTSRAACRARMMIEGVSGVHKLTDQHDKGNETPDAHPSDSRSSPISHRHNSSSKVQKHLGEGAAARKLRSKQEMKLAQMLQNDKDFDDDVDMLSYGNAHHAVTNSNGNPSGATATTGQVGLRGVAGGSRGSNGSNGNGGGGGGTGNSPTASGALRSSPSAPRTIRSASLNKNYNRYPRDYDTTDERDVAQGRSENVDPQMRQQLEGWQADHYDDQAGDDAGAQLQNDLDNVVDASQQDGNGQNAEAEEQPSSDPPQSNNDPQLNQGGDGGDGDGGGDEPSDEGSSKSKKDKKKKSKKKRKNTGPNKKTGKKDDSDDDYHDDDEGSDDDDDEDEDNDQPGKPKPPLSQKGQKNAAKPSKTNNQSKPTPPPVTVIVPTLNQGKPEPLTAEIVEKLIRSRAFHSERQQQRHNKWVRKRQRARQRTLREHLRASIALRDVADKMKGELDHVMTTLKAVSSP